MTTARDEEPSKQEFDSIQFCIDFWKDALDAADEIDHFVREMPRHIRTADDVA